MDYIELFIIIYIVTISCLIYYSPLMQDKYVRSLFRMTR